jgi:hypothetical protein
MLTPAGQRMMEDVRTERHLRHTFVLFAEMESDAVAYWRSLIPWNFANVRHHVARKGHGWRKEARASLIAVRVARRLIAEASHVS